MPPAQPRPPIPWGQNLSAFFNASGAFSVGTKFRQIDTYQTTLVMNASTAIAAYTAYPPYLVTSVARGKITGQLYYCASGGGGTLTSAVLGVTALTSTSVNIWATGIM